MENKSKYFWISHEKEIVDTKKLIDIIREAKWLSPDTVLVNCSPDYSSSLTLLINHKLSYINDNELFEVLNLEMPYPTMSQIWDGANYIPFDNYIYELVRDKISRSRNYLFIDSGTLRGKNFTKVRNVVKAKLEPSQFRFASLYVQDDSILIPDYFVEKFNKQKQGGLLFEWENADNPNWDY